MTDHKKSTLLETSKVAFLNYLSEHKEPKHNYQKRSIFWDREHVYNENLMLRNKIKELQQVNTKTKTRLLRSEKDVALLSSRSLPKFRSESIFKSSSSTQLNPQMQLSTMKWRIDALRQEQHSKKLLLMKQNIRQLKETVQNLKGQNAQLKKSIKYTRMSELQIQNKELQEEIIRLKDIINENKRVRQEMTKFFAEEKKDFRLILQKEVMEKNRISKELKKVQDQINQFTSSSRTKKSKDNRGFSAKMKKLEVENERLRFQIETTRSKIINTNASAVKQDNIRLEYSQSAFSQAPTPQMTYSYNPKNRGNEELTSLQLLTLKTPANEEYQTPMKEPESKHKEPASEPIMAREQVSTEVKKQVPQTESKSPLKNQAIPKDQVGQINQDVEEQFPVEEEEYEDLMDY